jgi:hypothetical protein
MYVRVGLIGMQNHRITVHRAEFRPGQLPRRLEYSFGRRSRRHGENQVMDELRRLSVRTHRPGTRSLVCFEIEVPIPHQGSFKAFNAKPVPGIGLNCEVSIAPEVSQALLHSG